MFSILDGWRAEHGAEAGSLAFHEFAEDGLITAKESPASERTIRTAEVARVLGVSVRAIRSWADSGKINCYRTLGGHRLFPLSEVERVVCELYGTDGATRIAALRVNEMEA